MSRCSARIVGRWAPAETQPTARAPRTAGPSRANRPIRPKAMRASPSPRPPAPLTRTAARPSTGSAIGGTDLEDYSAFAGCRTRADYVGFSACRDCASYVGGRSRGDFRPYRVNFLRLAAGRIDTTRSEEHTSELQSLTN